MAERGPLEIRPGVAIPEWELAAEFTRASGPGGQNVNKVETRVVLRFDLARSGALTSEQKALATRRLGPRLTARGELVVAASTHRSRERNYAEARERLAGLLRTALVPERVRRATRPSKGSVRRRLDAKRRRSGTKRARHGGDEE